MTSASKDRASIFSGSTLVPVSFVVTLLGGAGWLTSMQITGTTNTQKLAQIESEQKEKDKGVGGKLDSMDGRLSRMEGQLAVIYDLLKERKR